MRAIVGANVEDFVLVFFVVLVSLTVEKCRYNVANEGLIFVDLNYIRVGGLYRRMNLLAELEDWMRKYLGRDIRTEGSIYHLTNSQKAQ